MLQLKLKPGDRVAAQIEKSPEALALYAACAQAGLVFLPLNTAYTVDELAYFIDSSFLTLPLLKQVETYCVNKANLFGY